ncbi:SpoIIE family protein phosphatase [candidate division KSB1 bacterium]|nr:SpoIIE family protein phosphatase [candidate division KSB1 bacterium]
MKEFRQNAIEREKDQRLVELQSLFEMGQVLNSSLNLNSVLNNLLLTPMGRMMISRGLVLVGNDTNAFEVAVVKGLPRSLIGKKIFIDHELSEAKSLRDLDEHENIYLTFFQDLDIEILLPIISDNKTVGVMGLGRKLGQVDYTHAEIDYLNSLTTIASSAIQNAIMYQRMELVNRQLDKKIQELNTLFEIGKELNATLQKERIVNLLIYAIMGELVTSRCFVFLKEQSGMNLYAARGLHTNEPQLQPFMGRGFLKSLAKVDQPFLVEEAELSRNLQILPKENLKVVVPMQIQEKTKGVLVIGERITKQAYKTDEIDFLTTLCNLAMISIENARLFEETLEKQRIEEELNFARDIQQRLLPRECPKTEKIEIQGLNIPSRQVGGDYFDCIQLDENHIAVAIADVSGKGVPASLLMSSLQAGMRNLVTANGDIPSMVGKINNFIHANTSFDKFITFFYAEIDLVENTISYVNAGHNPPYLIHADGSWRLLEAGGLILGMMPDMPYENETVPMKKNDLILMYTDGVTEAKSTSDEDYDEERLEKILKKSYVSSVNELIDEIVADLRAFTKGAPQSDDITMMAVRFLQ